MDDHYLQETQGKSVHDPYLNINFEGSNRRRCILIQCPIIIGAGPSGLATAACLKSKGIPSLLLERSNCIASLWQSKAYDRLKLHLPKHFCQLPFIPFPSDFPDYPTKHQFVAYLKSYANHFQIKPIFNQQVDRAEFDDKFGLWRVTTSGSEVEYLSRWLVVATGENAEEAVPEIEGMADFGSKIVHTSSYRSGEGYIGKKTLVVGCGNSGMEVCLDLANHNARPSLVVRNSVHILPREILGKSTFGFSMWLSRWLPVWQVDRVLLAAARVILGDTARFGLNRPDLGPLEMKKRFGKTPVLDVGTFEKIKAGEIKVRPGITKFMHRLVEFEDGRIEDYDAIILATGYKSNVPSWLKENEMFSGKDGMPKKPFPNGWKGRSGLYAVGFSRLGLMGASMDAKNIAEDIEKAYYNYKNNSDVLWLQKLIV